MKPGIESVRCLIMFFRFDEVSQGEKAEEKVGVCPRMPGVFFQGPLKFAKRFRNLPSTLKSQPLQVVVFRL